MLTLAAIHPHHAHPVVWVSLITLQACGIGIAFGGSVVLALGLLGGARTFAMRMIGSGNSVSLLNVQAAENRADAQTGVLALRVSKHAALARVVWFRCEGCGYELMNIPLKRNPGAGSGWVGTMRVYVPGKMTSPVTLKALLSSRCQPMGGNVNERS